MTIHARQVLMPRDYGTKRSEGFSFSPTEIAGLRYPHPSLAHLA